MSKFISSEITFWSCMILIFIILYHKSMSSVHVSRVRQLYKLIFRLHRGLPAELRVIGDNYARDEFKRHKKCNEHEANIFMNEWTDYAINLARQMKPLQQAKKKTVGKYLDPKVLDYMNDEQLMQLYELHQAANPGTVAEDEVKQLKNVIDKSSK